MDNAIYSMLAGNIGEQNRALKSSNNIANSNTDGFKSDEIVFRKYLTKDVRGDITFPYDEKTVVNFSQGAPRQTKHQLDLMIDGQGFFSVAAPQGVRYTRQGHYYRNSDNVIVTIMGYPLLSVEGRPIVLNEDDIGVVILENGEVYGQYRDGDATDSPVRQELRGQISVVDFTDRKALRKEGDILFNSSELPIVTENYKIVQGAVEESVINPITEMSSLVALQNKIENESALISKMYSLESSAYNALSLQPK